MGFHHRIISKTIIRYRVPKIRVRKNPPCRERIDFGGDGYHHKKFRSERSIFFVMIMVERNIFDEIKENLPESSERSEVLVRYTTKDLSEWRGNLLRDDHLCANHEKNISRTSKKSKKSSLRRISTNDGTALVRWEYRKIRSEVKRKFSLENLLTKIYENIKSNESYLQNNKIYYGKNYGETYPVTLFTGNGTEGCIIVAGHDSVAFGTPIRLWITGEQVSVLTSSLLDPTNTERRAGVVAELLSTVTS